MVTALSGHDLTTSGVTNMTAIGQVVPGFHVDSSGNFFEPSLRGVGTDIAGSDSNIATYIDGVYEPNPLAWGFDFFDVKSIQVLEGPQGTLFGRDATGGAILVTTLQPSFTTHIKASLGYGSFNEIRTNVFATTGLTNDLAGSIALGYTHSDGWITNVLTGRDANPNYNYLARGKLLFKPNGKWRSILTITADGQNDPTLFATSSWHGYSDAAAFFGVPVITGNDPRKVSLSGRFGHKVFSLSGNLKIVGNLGFATFTSITAAEHDRGREYTNQSASAYPANGTLPVQPCPTLLTCSFLGTGGYTFLESASWFYTENTYSQEFDLAHTGGPVDWVGGLYYFYDAYQYNPFNTSLYGPFGPGGALTGALPPWPASAYVNTGDQHTFTMGTSAQSIAAFFNATYKLGTLTTALDKFYLTGGVRWDVDRAGVDYRAFPSVATGFTSTGYESAAQNFYSWSPRAVLRYAATHDSNIYVSYSIGVAPGLFSPSTFGTDKSPAKSERLYDVEAGYKISKRNWKLQASIFHYNYRNLQVNTYLGCCAVIFNAPYSKIYGLDLAWQQRLSRYFRLDFGFAYTHARYQYFPDASVQEFSSLYGVEAGSAFVKNVSGGMMEHTPEFSGNISPAFYIPLFGGTLTLHGHYSYRSRTFFDFAGAQRQGGYGLLNARISWTNPSGQWTYSISGQNVTNKSYLVQLLANSGGFGQAFGEPASVMAEVTYDR